MRLEGTAPPILPLSSLGGLHDKGNNREGPDSDAKAPGVGSSGRGKGVGAMRLQRKKHPTTREKRKKRRPKTAEVLTILGTVAGLITAIAHLIQALK